MIDATRRRNPSPVAAPLLATLAALSAVAFGCAAPSGIHPRGFPAEALPIDLERFMGDWFVIAHIPTSVESEAHEAVESYSLRGGGGIDVRYRFCEGALDGPATELSMRAWVFDPATNAEWRVRPFWPLRLEYQILELDPDYRVTVVGHPSRRYAWVMARSPSLSEDRLVGIVERLTERGFETERLRLVPQDDGLCRSTEGT